MALKTVYLDSNDFSDLSAAQDKLRDVDRAVLALLREAKTAGRARFFISPVHISEAVHASETYRDAAVRRAELMRELGAENFLKFPIEICTQELTRALANANPIKSTLAQITSRPDEWFGISDALKGISKLRDETNETIRKELRKTTPNRQAYRKNSKSSTQPKNDRIRNGWKFSKMDCQNQPQQTFRLVYSIQNWSLVGFFGMYQMKNFVRTLFV
jgi:hypothetical protein